jgi:cobalt-zinc-cadmium efflux system membrane fusion protein
MSQTFTDHPAAEEADSSRSPLSRNESARRFSVRRIVGWFLSVLPTLVVLAALGGIAYWGHHTGWKVPRFSELTGKAAEPVDDWCSVHNVPESECIECIPTLLPGQTDHGWCKDHGVHQCPLCHPEVAELKSTPRIDQARLNAVSLALSVRDRKENNLGCTLYRSRVQFASVDAVREAGIDVELAETRPIVESISANGEIIYDETRVAHLVPRLPGTIARVGKSVGDRVRKGDVLALIDSADVGKAKAKLLDAMAQVSFHRKTVARLAPLRSKGAISGSRLLEAETALQQAEIQLRQAEQTLVNLGLPVSSKTLEPMSVDERSEYMQFLGLPDIIRNQLSASTTSSNLIPIVASLDGVVVHREAVPGEYVDPSQMLFQLADTSRMWLCFNVAMEDAKHLKIGQAVRFRPDGVREEVSGVLSWISTEVDRQTRTVEVRAEVDNPEGSLRNETFGLGRIILRETSDAVVVPRSAVHWDGSCFVTFVRDRHYFEDGHPKIFHARTIRPGVSADGFTEIIAGVLPGEVVATTGSSVLRSQILKNNLGAGCTCGH